MGQAIAGEPDLNADAHSQMSVPQLLHRLFTMQNELTTVYECRYCGTTIDSQTDPCPYCGPTEVVEYKFS